MKRQPQLNPVANAFEPLARFIAIAGGYWLMLIAAATCIEIISRKLFSFSLLGVDEVGGYTLAVLAALGFSYALVDRAHTRIDFLIGRLPAVVKATANVLAMFTLAAMAIFAVWRGLDVLKESLEFQSRAPTPLQTPLWIPQAFWLAGLAFFALVATALALHAGVLMVRDRGRLNTFYGPPSLEEEIEKEVGALRERQDSPT